MCLINVQSGFTKTPLGAISALVGEAMIKHDGDSVWVKVKMRGKVLENDAISVGAESQCEITLSGDKIVRLGEKTVAVITEKTADQTKVKMLKGSLWINVKHLVNNNSFDVSTSTAVAAIAGRFSGLPAIPMGRATRFFAVRLR